MQCNQLHLCRNSLCGFALFCSIFHFYVFELHLLVPLIPINYLYVPKPFEIFGELFADFFAVGASVEFSGNESMKEETLTAPTKSRHPLALHGTCCPPHTPFRNSVTLEDTVHGSSNDVNVVVQWYFYWWPIRIHCALGFERAGEGCQRTVTMTRALILSRCSTHFSFAACWPLLCLLAVW